MAEDAVFEFIDILFMPWHVLGSHSALGGLFLKCGGDRHVTSEDLYVLGYGFYV